MVITAPRIPQPRLDALMAERTTRRRRHRIVLSAALIVSLGSCNGDDPTTPKPNGHVTVTIHASKEVVSPGDRVFVTVLAEPPTQVKLDTIVVSATGIFALADTIVVDLPTTGPRALTDTMFMPPAVGNVILTATARGPGARGSSAPLSITVRDTTPPDVRRVSVSPPFSPWDSVTRPGDRYLIQYEASDAEALTRTIIHTYGAFTSDTTFDERGGQSVGRLVMVEAPAETRRGVPLLFEVEAVDAGGTSRFAHPGASNTTVTGVSPSVLGFATGPAGAAKYLVTGDALDITVVARDTSALTWIGYELAAPQPVRDSQPVSGRAATLHFAHMVDGVWGERTMELTVFARSAGGRSTFAAGRVETLAAVSRPTRTVSLPAPVRDLAFDTRRNAVYLTDSAFSRIDVLSLATATPTSSIPLSAPPTTLDLSRDGDSLVVGLHGLMALDVVDLVNDSHAKRRVNLVADPLTDRWPNALRVAGNGRTLIALTFNGTGYGGEVIDFDLATGSQKGLAYATSVSEVVSVTRSADGEKVLVLDEYGSWPMRGLIYSSSSGTVATTGTTESGVYFPSKSASAAGDRFLVDTALFDETLAPLRGVSSPHSFTQKGISIIAPTTITPDGSSALIGTPYGYDRVRLADNAVTERTRLPIAPSVLPRRFAISPDGQVLIVITDDQHLLVVDLR
jgi:hypothetical protein